MTLPPLPLGTVWVRYAEHGPDGAYTADQMRAYAQAAVLAERAACIQLVNGTESQMHDERDFTLREAIVAAIRARS